MVCGATCLVFPQHAANPWAAASSILWCSASSSRKTQRRSVIDLPAIAAPVDRNHGAKDNERSLSGSIDKGPLAACRSRSPAKAKTRKSDRPDWRKSSHGRAGHADAPGRASGWRLPHGTAERAGKSSRAGAWVAHSPWGSRSRVSGSCPMKREWAPEQTATRHFTCQPQNHSARHARPCVRRA